MKKTFNVLPPSMPNFVRFEVPSGVRQDGFKAADGFDICDFTESEAKEYAELMRNTFMEHWRNRKEKRNGGKVISKQQFITRTV